ncbi:MAG: FAD-dependent oxidoreductase [Oligoflexales bacterium]
MSEQDHKDAEIYHRIVDCQYACPAHTPVPEYIRLIAQGRYDEAYLVNRSSNVFPGILGRVCDRPCEPACRRGRVDGEAVAICRLKRAAADRKGDVLSHIPSSPFPQNGKKIALIGAGPASLTVANDLLPLGYNCVVFEKDSTLGGAMQTQVPGFRLPQEVLDEEINMILNMGLDVQASQQIESLESLFTDGFDAVFVGVGAPRGKSLKLPGLEVVEESVFVGVDFLGAVRFDHPFELGEQTIVIGGGNTAMDCARSAVRKKSSVTVVAPEGFQQMSASPWELDETIEEGVTIRNHLLPVGYRSEFGKLVGVEFRKVTSLYDEQGSFAPKFVDSEVIFIACSSVILAIGQVCDYSFLDGKTKWLNEKGKLIIDPQTLQSSHPKVFFGGDAAFGPSNIISAVAHGHEAAISMHLFLQNKPLVNRPRMQMELLTQKMSLNQWSYDNQFDQFSRQKNEKDHKNPGLIKEVEFGLSDEQIQKECSRCLNCDVQTVFEEKLCIECDACVDICPVGCLQMTDVTDEAQIREDFRIPARNMSQPLFLSGLSSGRLMAKDENICLHCGLCSERCPTGAWDMKLSSLKLPKAGDLCED